MRAGPFRVSEAANILRSRKFLIVFALLAGVFSPIAALSSHAKDTNAERFLALTILNDDMKIGQYFASNATTIAPEENVNWYVKVQNGMDKSEFINIKMKLLNSTGQGPDDLSNTPSPEQEIISFTHVLPPGSTWITPLNWTVDKTEIQDGQVFINRVTMNDKVVDNLDIGSVDGKNFRILIELWRYDTNIKDFTFVWPSSLNETRSVWNQIWFNIKS